jgi:hypothetical protein
MPVRIPTGHVVVGSVRSVMRTGQTETRTAHHSPLRRVLVQMEPSLHRRLASHAQAKQVSIEEVIVDAVQRELGEPVTRYPPPPEPDRETVSLLRANLIAVAAAIALGVALVATALALGW